MTRHQRWAKGALEAVTHAKNPSEYRTLCMTTPFLIKQSGLVQAVAFLWRDKKNHGFVNDLAKVLNGSSGDKLRDDAHDAPDLAAYMALTRDAIAVAVWFRRFAQSELGDTNSETSA